MGLNIVYYYGARLGANSRIQPLYYLKFVTVVKNTVAYSSSV
jgi:hypothetical protein